MEKQKILTETEKAIDLYKYAEKKGLSVKEAKRIIRIGMTAEYESTLSYKESWKEFKNVLPSPKEQTRQWQKVIKKGLRLAQPFPENMELPENDGRTIGYMLCYWEKGFIPKFLNFMKNRISKKTDLEFNEIQHTPTSRKRGYGFYWARLHLVKNISTKRGKNIRFLDPVRRRWFIPGHETLIWHLLTCVGYAQMEQENTNLPHFITNCLRYKNESRYNMYIPFLHFLSNKKKLHLMAKTSRDENPIYYPKHYIAISYK